MSQLSPAKLLKSFRSKRYLRLSNSPSQSDHSIASDHDHVDDAILAFHTTGITTMLSLIQSPTEFTSTERKDLSDDQRRELKVLDTLSAVIVREHKIAAVMAKAFDGCGIEVLASVDNLKPAFYIPQHSESRPVWNPLRWLITPNPRNPR